VESGHTFTEPRGGLKDDLPIRELIAEGTRQLASDLVAKTAERLRNNDETHGHLPLSMSHPDLTMAPRHFPVNDSEPGGMT
jgi:hypothetical protein